MLEKESEKRFDEDDFIIFPLCLLNYYYLLNNINN